MPDRLTVDELEQIGRALAAGQLLAIQEAIKTAFHEHQATYCDAHAKELARLRRQIEDSTDGVNQKLTLKGRVDQVESNQTRALWIGGSVGAIAGFIGSSFVGLFWNWLMKKLGVNP